MRFAPELGRPFESPNITGFSYNEPEEFPELSASRMEVRGWHGLVRSASSRCFHVLDGEGTFVISGREFPVKQGDVVLVPRGEPHDFTGEMTLFIVHSPAFRKETTTVLE